MTPVATGTGPYPAVTRPLLTYTSADHRFQVGKRDVACAPSSPVPYVSYQGRVFCDQGLQPDTVFELDATGHTLATALPGHVVAISDRYAVFAGGQSYPGTFAVYGVAARP